jgi:hypothetical protein
VPEAGDRYTIGGLVTLYAIEPSIRDVFVEGHTDVGVISWFLTSSGLNPSVFSIDDRVLVPGELVDEIGQDRSSRGRALALAFAIERDLGSDCLAATVVVDADFDDPVVLRGIAASVLPTDFPSIENYAFQERPLEKLLRNCLHAPAEVTTAAVYEAIFPALADVFFCRKFLKAVGVAVVNDPRACCNLIAGESKADIPDLLRRSCSRLSAGDGRPDLTEVESNVARARSTSVPSLMFARGHDIAGFISRFLRVAGPLRDPDALEKAALGCVEMSDLDGHPMFLALRTRV